MSELDIVKRLQAVLDYHKPGSYVENPCKCDPDVGMVCEYCSEMDLLASCKREIERLRTALAPFAATGKGIPDNWPGCCQLRIDARRDGSEFLSYHGIPEMEHSEKALPTLAEWKEAAEAAGGDDE